MVADKTATSSQIKTIELIGKLDETHLKDGLEQLTRL
jgi:hypothetical protein